MQKFTIENLEIRTVGRSFDRICYILYPMDSLAGWMEKAARTYGLTIVGVSGMDWDDDLTPWPAKGQPPGSPDFKGLAPRFLSTLVRDILPQVERRLDMSDRVERTLAGVSLSGLFTLWQWMHDDTFHNIISLSGSFWYEGFADWILHRPVPAGKGKAYFLLGDREAWTNVKAFQSVQTDTQKIVVYLHDKGIDDMFELVPGNHYQYGERRLSRAFARMFSGASLRDNHIESYEN